MTLAKWVHLFTFRTQQLSPFRLRSASQKLRRTGSADLPTVALAKVGGSASSRCVRVGRRQDSELFFRLRGSVEIDMFTVDLGLRWRSRFDAINSGSYVVDLC